MSDANTAASAAKASPAAAFPDAAARRASGANARAPLAASASRAASHSGGMALDTSTAEGLPGRRGGELEVEQGNLRPHLDGERGVGGVGVASLSRALAASTRAASRRTRSACFRSSVVSTTGACEPSRWTSASSCEGKSSAPSVSRSSAVAPAASFSSARATTACSLMSDSAARARRRR